MRNFLRSIAFLIILAIPATALARTAEATFERDLAVNGRVDLTVATGAGSIHLTTGPAGHVHIVGRIRSSWGGSDSRVHEIADHPPIVQTGNVVRIGGGHENLHNISIDYEIQAPPDALLNAETGSGDLTDEGVGANAKFSTGSGSIRATGMQGGFTAETGSGDIDAEQTSAGDVKLETGSGDIEIKNMHGGLRAEAGSGNIKANGVPSGPWRLETGSGSIEIWTGAAAFTLDAEAGSGSIHCDREITMQGSLGRHHVAGKVGGGGPAVRAETGSGSIRIH